MENTTPMMKQYMEAKNLVPGKLLFFRMGDFYELFSDDATTAAPILGIALTSRDKKNPIPMCGVPYHAVSSYISKLTQKGYSVAICEQVEDPKKAKGIVKRQITRVVTPSLVYDTDVIDAKQTSYLCAITIKENGNWSFAYLDYSTGDFKANSVINTDGLIKELSLISPREIICEKGMELPDVLSKFLLNVTFSVVDIKNNSSQKQLNSMIVDSRLDEKELKAGKMALSYLIDTQFRETFPHIRHFAKVSSAEYLGIDEFTSRNLDLFDSFIKNIDETRTAMGGRLLRQCVSQPLVNIDKINKRLDLVDRFVNDISILDKTRSFLSQCSDIDRLSSRIALGQYSPRDIRNLFETLELVHNMRKTLDEAGINYGHDIFREELIGFAKRIDEQLNVVLPATSKEAGIFKKGFYPELDELIDLHTNSRQVLLDMEKREKERTGISSLKIKYNKIFGYYIEISNANIHLAPKDYQRKQTLVNGERFITPELRELEIKLLSAEQKRIELEVELLNSLVEEFSLKHLENTLYISSFTAEVDLLTCFAYIAVKRSYTKPVIHEAYDLELKDARHPVLDQTMGADFVPNDVVLNSDDFFHIITGPNMAGKSTLMRTVALLVIMGHMGSYVPASYAKIPITDRVFTRVGATDYILQGQSTFMVEMIEASNIIYSATKNSLIILDEIGRGTSTYDGISIAWAIAEYIHQKISAKCMFATHYHELVALQNELNGVSNFSMSVEEEKSGLFFLRKLVKRPASKSYGIQVASMAGLPDSLIKRAYSIMKDLEEERKHTEIKIEKDQLSLFDKKEDESYRFIDELANIDLDKLTPIDALGRLYKWKEEVNKIEQS